MRFKSSGAGLTALLGIGLFIGQAISFADSDLKHKDYRFADGATIRIHYSESLLREAGEGPEFAGEVLDAAVSAYQNITQFNGFSTPGYTFARADKKYAYDPDQTIDIYLGDVASDVFSDNGFKGESFKDAPCFDTIRVSKSGFQAAILLPVRYREFIRNWERLNPSSLGPRNIGVDLRGTLTHEMLHAVLFYYNRNLNKDLMGPASKNHSAAEGIGKKVDWYVEGLARYFETLGGARHDFYSQGFKQVLPDRIRFSRGGSNYYMRYPDQAFTHLRYENALFWRYLDHHFGMPAIERISRELREPSQQNFRRALEKVLRIRLEELLDRFSEALLFKDFGLKEDEIYLKDVARTQLAYKNNGLSLIDGYGNKKYLGASCSTDWIGSWADLKARFGDFPVGGDNTPDADVSPWATDFIEIDLRESGETLPKLWVSHTRGGMALSARIYLKTRAGHILKKDLGDIPGAQEKGLALSALIKKEGLVAADIDRAYILITNIDPDRSSNYRIDVR